MPELPEVETIRRDLAPALEGRTITGIRVRHEDILLAPRRREEFRRRVEGRRITAVDRRGKWLLFRLEDGVLVTQLRMTGRFCIGPGPRPPIADFRHVAAEIDLDDGRTLFYDDVRRLGGFLWLTPAAWTREEARFGPEPLDRGFRTVDLGAALSRGSAPVKNALLDQSRIAGVGNIYASEALHGARIDPRRSGRSLNADEVRRLHRSLRSVLRRALENAGTTFRDYRAVNGRSGRFQGRLRVYGREGEPCRRCGSEIRRIVQAGRSTFFCPGCQA
jgi:formamidopyrimidine-DNA glycosylase